MLYDIDRTLEKIKKDRESNEFCDLVYDVESYVIDLMYAGDERIRDINPEKQEKKGRARVCEYIINEKEYTQVIAVLTPVLCELGIPRQIKGFRILEDCVLEAAREVINRRPYYMMNIYPKVAQKYGITPNNAEKLCRYACKCITVNRSTIAKYPFVEALTRREYEAITLKEAIDVLVNFVVENCKFKAKTR